MRKPEAAIREPDWDNVLTRVSLSPVQARRVFSSQLVWNEVMLFLNPVLPTSYLSREPACANTMVLLVSVLNRKHINYECSLGIPS